MAASPDSEDEQQTFYADQGALYCITTISNARSDHRTIDVTVTKTADPELYQPPVDDAGGPPIQLPPAGPGNVAVGDVLAHRRTPAPVGEAVPYVTEIGILTEQGKPDPAQPLSPGRYECRVQLSVTSSDAVEFEIGCPAGAIAEGSVCTADRALCPARGAGKNGTACACLGGAWACSPP